MNAALKMSPAQMPGPKVHLEPDELIPFYWSAGLIVDPMFIKYYIGVKDTKYYIDSRKMRSNIHLGLLDWLSPSIAESLMTSYTHFSEGQRYIGVEPYTFKQPGGLVLSSFQMYNCSRASYQQLPIENNRHLVIFDSVP